MARSEDRLPGTPSGMAELLAVVSVLGFKADDAWVAYHGIGGNATAATVAAWLDRSEAPSAFEYNQLAAALNDELRDRNLEASIPYADDRSD